MFESESRYAPLPQLTHTEPDGREIVYVARRFLPRTDRLFATARVAITEGDRLDLAAARGVGEAQAWWRLADANPSLHPDTLEVPGTELLIAIEAP